jgi:hypothetical protein
VSNTSRWAITPLLEAKFARCSVAALDGTDDSKLFCFRENAAGLRQLQRLRQEAATAADSTSSESNTSESLDQPADIDLDMSVDEAEDTEPLISDDDYQDSCSGDDSGDD